MEANPVAILPQDMLSFTRRYPAAIFNANRIQGVLVLAKKPTNGQVLAYSSANDRYEPSTPSGGGGGGGAITPAQLTSDANDYSPTGLSTAGTVRVSGDSSFRTITGLDATGATDATTIRLRNVGSNSILLSEQNTASSAANRFKFSGYDILLYPGRTIELQYDATDSRWYCEDANPGSIPSKYGWVNRASFESIPSATGGNWLTIMTGAGATAAVGTNLVLGTPYLILPTGTTATGAGGFGNTTSTGTQLGNGLYLCWEARVQLGSLSNGTDTYEAALGFLAGLPTGSKMMAFHYTDGVNGGRWQVTSDVTTQDTGVAAVATTFTKFKIIVNPAGTEVKFYIDDVLTNTITTLPVTTFQLRTGVAIRKSVGTTSISMRCHGFQLISYRAN